MRRLHAPELGKDAQMLHRREVVPQLVVLRAHAQQLPHVTHAVRDAVAADKGVGEIETLIKGGDAAKRILKCAKKVDADLIIIGSRGLGNIKGAFLGSVSGKVSRKAKGSCVTIRS